MDAENNINVTKSNINPTKSSMRRKATRLTKNQYVVRRKPQNLKLYSGFEHILWKLFKARGN